MKIIDVCAFYSPFGGGVKTYINRKLAVAGAHGHEILIIAPGKEEGFERRGPNSGIIHVASPTLPFDRRYRYFADPAAIHAVLDRERPDIVEASSPWRTARIVADWQGPAPRSLVMHADPMSAYAYRWFGLVADRATIDRQFEWFWRHLRTSAARFDSVICANRDLARRLQEGGIAHACTIAMGIDPGVFSPSLRDEALRSQLLAHCGLGVEAVLLIGVGRHSAEKRWPMVIDACARAALERPIGLVLVGGGRQEGRITRHIGGNPHIQPLAPIADRHRLAAILASSDVLIHGCEAETFGLVAAEAAASGLPLIVPGEGGAADFADPACAETFRPADVDSATAAILRLLARPRDALAAAARRRASGARTMDMHFDDLFALYERLACRASEAA